MPSMLKVVVAASRRLRNEMGIGRVRMQFLIFALPSVSDEARGMYSFPSHLQSRSVHVLRAR